MLRASAESIKLFSIYGSPGNDGYHSSNPFANIVEIDGVKILLDCGWSDDFDVNYLNTLLPYLHDVHGVLFSTPELCSCGALPFVMEHIRPGTHVAAAGSTSKMGLHGVLHPFLYLFPNSHTFQVGSAGQFEMTVDKIYSAFRSVTEPYGGKVIIRHKDIEVECYPVFSGRMLGGHGWLIKYQIDELFYCPDFSLSPSYALKQFVPPATSTILFIDGSPLHFSGNSGRKYEEQRNLFIREVLGTLRNGKDVLIPVSAAGRGLEVLNIVTQLLTEKGGDSYTVVFASLQATELLGKAITMTEALLDDIILGEQQLFAKVITCKTAQEVIGITGPKICVADGETLDYGLAAELLEFFLRCDSEERENLIVLPAIPKVHTNAFAIATSSKGEPLELKYTRRSPLNREELEEYYVQLELELDDQRKAMEGGTYEVAAMDDRASDRDDEKENEIDSTNLKMCQCTPGLVLPSYMNYFSKNLQFPVLESTGSLNAAVLKKIDCSYGLPVSDELQMLMRRKAPARIYSDEGPEGVQLNNDAQAEANIPSKTMVVNTKIYKNARVLLSDFSGLADATILRTLLRTQFSFAKKIVMIRGTLEDHRALIQYCRAEKQMKCGENVFLSRALGLPLELATHVYSYTVQLDPTLANTLPNSLRRVKESRAKGLWDVGWIDGELINSISQNDEEDISAHESKRIKLESNTLDNNFTLTFLNNKQSQKCALERAARGSQKGSFYVGEVDLHKLRDVARTEVGLRSEFYKNSSMLVFDAGMCVRKSADGNITLSSVVSPSVFSLQKTVYDQFAQIL